MLVRECCLSVSVRLNLIELNCVESENGSSDGNTSAMPVGTEDVCGV